MVRQKLPRSIAPAYEEAIDGYLERLAWRLQVPLTQLLHAAGLTRSPGYAHLPRGIVVQLSPTQATGIMAATGVSPDELHAMTLARYDGICVSFRGHKPGVGDAIRALAVREWISTTASWACPTCLSAADPATSATGVWRIQWRLPWSFACREHEVLMARDCPHCGLPYRVGNPRSGSVPAFSGVVLDPGVCRNSVTRRDGRGTEPCGHPHADSISLSLQHAPRTLAAASALGLALSGGEASVLGSRATTLDYFRAARSITALLLTVARSDDLGPIPSAALTSFENHVARRQDVRSRARPYTALPRDPALMAALSPFIVELLGTTERDEAAAMVAPLVSRLPRHIRMANLCRNISAAEPLRSVLSAAGGRTTSLRSRLTPNDREAHRDAASRVPQLLWEEQFDREFARLLPGTKQNFARRFCSVALVSHLVDCDWGEAASRLGLPATRTVSLAYACGARLKAHGAEDEFARRIVHLGDRVRSNASLPNLAHRRAALSTLDEVPRDVWAEICRNANVTRGKPVRRHFAAVWLWCDLGGGDYQLAPQLAAQPATRRNPAVTRYGRFVKSEAQLLAAVASGLREFGLKFLNDL